MKVTIVVTGASRGFGRSIAKEFCKGWNDQGHSLRFVLTARDESSLINLQHELEVDGAGNDSLISFQMVIEFFRLVEIYLYINEVAKWKTRLSNDNRYIARSAFHTSFVGYRTFICHFILTKVTRHTIPYHFLCNSRHLYHWES